MLFTAKDRERLERVEGKLDALLVKLGEAEALRQQNRELFDRLMARNWEQWVNSPAVAQAIKEDMTQVVLRPSQDEAKIGEVMSDEELGK